MSLLAVQQLMFDLKRDKSRAALWLSDADQVQQDYVLTPEEASALKTGDLPALYRMGVHPLLLAPFSRMARIPRPQYQADLNPLKGERPMVSTYQLGTSER